MSDRELTHQSYSDKSSPERVISNISNQKFNVQTGNVKDQISSNQDILITHPRAGMGELLKNSDQNSEKINANLKESVKLDEFAKNLVFRYLKNPKSSTSLVSH